MDSHLEMWMFLYPCHLLRYQGEHSTLTSFAMGGKLQCVGRNE